MTVEKRRKPRKGCKIRACIRSGTSERTAYVVDFNEHGMRLLIENAIKTISENDEIEVQTQELGILKGRARWLSSHRVGIEIHDGVDNLAWLRNDWDDAQIAERDDAPIEEALVRVAEQPELFTKAQMADLMKQAADRIRSDQRMLTRVRTMLATSGEHPSIAASGRSRQGH
jgi:hypothetical protein